MAAPPLQHLISEQLHFCETIGIISDVAEGAYCFYGSNGSGE